MWKAPPVKTPELLNELVGDHEKLTVNGVQFFLGMVSLLKEGPAQKNKSGLLSSIKPPSVPSTATVAFPIEWLLVRDANVFTGDVASEYC